MTEFAIVAPILLLLFFGVLDFGRVMYIYGTLVQAANEGARVSIRASTPLPTDDDVLTSAKIHAQSLRLANPCPNGPIPNGGNPQGSPQLPPSNTGWIFVTDPSAAGNGVPNGPRGGLGTLPAPGPGCNAITPAVGNEPIKVTLWFNFQPITPLIQQVVGNKIVITAYAVYRAEYSN